LKFIFNYWLFFQKEFAQKTTFTVRLQFHYTIYPRKTKIPKFGIFVFSNRLKLIAANLAGQ